MPSPSDAVAAGASVREAIDLRRFPWIRPLVGEYTQNFARLAPLFAGNPSDPDAWRTTIARVSKAPRDRAAIHAALIRQLSRRGAPEEARRSADRLASPSSVAIVTGQQAGVFGGPLYTLLKAVTAIQLAQRVTQDYGTEAVPVFWVDAEDHDWDEVRSARILDSQFNVADVTVPDPEGAGSLPVAKLVFDEGVAAALDELARLLPPTEFTAEVMESLRRRYFPGAGVSAAFAGWIEDLLGRQGLVVFEADDPSVKPLVADLFERELQHPCTTSKLATEAGALMSSLGHSPQVVPSEDSVALFYLDGTSRKGIKRQAGAYTVGDGVRSVADVCAEAKAHPERFSPNVLLRPIVQDRLFPTACYVAGPSELAYQAQLGGIYREFGVEAPLLHSRASATIVDSAAARFLDRSKLPLEALHAQDESALNRFLEAQLPPDLDRVISELGELVGGRADVLKVTATTVDPTLAGAVDTTVDRIRETLNSLQSKIIQAAKRKDETLRRQFTRTRALCFPGGDPQERALSLPFFFNRYGLSLGDRLIASLPLETDRHYSLML
ncbi:MAG TPA: bacillithiol biosynthesis cysteine-adding enzyme BshC [Vicinamibacterales bacterium]|nr:bacillithiol biosynthesis cysteine-adding enzyme BshC [Vicinamibacterales bacterium]